MMYVAQIDTDPNVVEDARRWYPPDEEPTPLSIDRRIDADTFGHIKRENLRRIKNERELEMINRR